jgi:hypothetical protein
MANKNLTFGLCCTPADIVDTQELGVTEILISYGGGMGGANRKYHVLESRAKDKGSDLLVLDLLDGTTITINTNFIVSYTEKKVIRIETDITQRSENFNTVVNYYAMDLNDTYTIQKTKFIHEMPNNILTIKK